MKKYILCILLLAGCQKELQPDSLKEPTPIPDTIPDTHITKFRIAGSSTAIRIVYFTATDTKGHTIKLGLYENDGTMEAEWPLDGDGDYKIEVAIGYRTDRYFAITSDGKQIKRKQY